MATPLTIARLGLVDSTQDEARTRFGGAPVLVSASGQNAGRGRSGSAWLNADRSVAASLAFEPAWPIDAVAPITLVAGLAAADVLPDFVGLKWPNDLTAGDLKIGGILTEASGTLVVVGLGLNVYWKSPPPGMGAMHSSDPGEDHGHLIAERWALVLQRRVAEGPTAWGRDEYVSRCTTIGEAVEWEPDGSGVAVGVGEDGSLLVDSASGRVAIDSGEVRHVRST